MRNQLLIAFFVFLFLSPANGQSQSQNNFLDSLTYKFEKYCETIPREEIYVHTDRQQYIAGEELWFGIYLFDRQSSKPSSESKIAYLEILNSENRPVVQKRILLENSFGPGQIQLPDSLSSGVYTIRAYTNWMKNFLPINCFTGKLKILNALNEKRSADSKPKDPSYQRISSYGKEPGVTIDIRNINPDYVEIALKSDSQFRQLNGIVYIFVQTHGLINFKNTLILSGDVTNAFIPPVLICT
jgi:hypothetical protein